MEREISFKKFLWRKTLFIELFECVDSGSNMGMKSNFVMLKRNVEITLLQCIAKIVPLFS